MHRDRKLQLIRRWFYPDTSTTRWLDIVNSYCHAGAEVCEIGSGSGKFPQNQNYPEVSSIFGIDLDTRVLTNPNLGDARVGSADDLCALVEGRKFDVIYSHMCAEHVENPESFIRPQLKCLKQDGMIIHSTVSKFYWTSMINRFVPRRIKAWLIREIASGRTADDIFPAFYRLNSKAAIQSYSELFDIDFEIHRFDLPPGFLRRSLILMLIFTGIHRPLQFLVPSIRPGFVFVLKRKRPVNG